ncbi:acyl-CoA thioesterase [Psychrobacillus lasiicapitis]|uniref:Acyl-CoA thioesterase n=1 Tax=Psychrobacillus lasiicapitis TaxID=1636719 RepID=A0A544TGZ3_9BACI|nr:thioesterase family protein [Psychrobacillus lasiicapitis]TQR16707.1 acyl-CoA thioesterase [Psychrobacillus lasiicapitis]GGA27896.1 4-hydroxybenzoyl-CoA thioesterase [Psychrobacillus lasiicapitis]
MFISEKEIEVRYAETDQMGVVYHANYVIWLEIGRTQLIKDLGFSYAGLEKDGYLSPVTNVNINYKSSVRYGETVVVRTWIESHGKLRTTYGYEIVHEDGSVASSATSEHVVVNKDNFRPVSLKKVHPEWDAKYTEIAKVMD